MLIRAIGFFLSLTQGLRTFRRPWFLFFFFGLCRTRRSLNPNETCLVASALASDLPRDLFHLAVAGQPPVFIVSALHDLEGNADRIIQAGAENDALAFCIALNDPRMGTRVATRLVAHGRAAVHLA